MDELTSAERAMSTAHSPANVKRHPLAAALADVGDDVCRKCGCRRVHITADITAGRVHNLWVVCRNCGAIIHMEASDES